MYDQGKENLKSEKICRIVCASDDNYAMPLTVMLKSLEMHTNLPVEIYVLDGGISYGSKYKIERSLSNKINFIDFRNVSFDFKHKEYMPITTYYRLLIPRIMGDYCEKVLYLDCDMVVLNDIYSLWNMDLDLKAAGAVPEMDKDAHYVSSKNGLPSYKILNIPGDVLYFNAGVLLMNLSKWRKEHIADRILKYLKDYEKYVLWHDQDGLNAILWNDWMQIDYRWNVMNRFFETANISESILGPELIAEIEKEPYIIHYNQLPKPWEEECRHPYKKEFYKYYRMTQWRNIDG